MARSEFHAQLDSLQARVLELGELTVVATDRVIGAVQEEDHVAAESIVANDGAIDQLHATIQHDAISLLARQQPTAGDLRAITAGMAIASELERIGDYALSTAKQVISRPQEPALPPTHDLYRMARAARRMLQRSLDAYATRDTSLARHIWNEDPAIDTFQQTLYQDLLTSMIKNPSTLTRATHHLWTVQRLERVADRATNICEQVIFMVDGEWPHFDALRDPTISAPSSAVETED